MRAINKCFHLLIIPRLFNIYRILLNCGDRGPWRRATRLSRAGYREIMRRTLTFHPIYLGPTSFTEGQLRLPRFLHFNIASPRRLPGNGHMCKPPPSPRRAVPKVKSRRSLGDAKNFGTGEARTCHHNLHKILKFIRGHFKV